MYSAVLQCTVIYVYTVYREILGDGSKPIITIFWGINIHISSYNLGYPLGTGLLTHNHSVPAFFVLNSESHHDPGSGSFWGFSPKCTVGGSCESYHVWEFIDIHDSYDYIIYIYVHSSNPKKREMQYIYIDNISLFHDWILLFYLFGETQAAVATSHDILYCWQCQLVATCPADPKNGDMVIQWNMNGT